MSGWAWVGLIGGAYLGFAAITVALWHGFCLIAEMGEPDCADDEDLLLLQAEAIVEAEATVLAVEDALRVLHEYEDGNQ